MEELYDLASDHSLWVVLGAVVVSVLCFGFALYCLLAGASFNAVRLLAGASFNAVRLRMILLVGTPVALLVVGGVVALAVYSSSGSGSGSEFQVSSGPAYTCDDLLRMQMMFQRGVSTADRMNDLIKSVHPARDFCSRELWHPEVDDSTSGVGVGGCFRPPSAAGGPGGRPMVGHRTVPYGLLDESLGEGVVRATSGRDSSNNIIVYWSSEVSKRPLDGSICWLYVSRLNLWAENY